MQTRRGEDLRTNVCRKAHEQSGASTNPALGPQGHRPEEEGSHPLLTQMQLLLPHPSLPTLGR